MIEDIQKAFTFWKEWIFFTFTYIFMDTFLTRLGKHDWSKYKMLLEVSLEFSQIYRHKYNIEILEFYTAAEMMCQTHSFARLV